MRAPFSDKAVKHATVAVHVAAYVPPSGILVATILSLSFTFVSLFNDHNDRWFRIVALSDPINTKQNAKIDFAFCLPMGCCFCNAQTKYLATP